MSKKDIIAREVQKTMDCLQPFEKLPASPYFFTRLQAEMNSRRQEAENHKGLFSSRLWRPAFIALVVLLNLTTAVLIYNSRDQGKDFSNDTLTVLASEYNLGQDDSDLFSNSK